MNMFKTIFTVFFFAYGASLYLLQPETWTWPIKISPYVQQFVLWSIELMPFSALGCFALGLVLVFMRKSY